MPSSFALNIKKKRNTNSYEYRYILIYSRVYSADTTQSAIQIVKSHLKRGQFYGNFIYLSIYYLYLVPIYTQYHFEVMFIQFFLAGTLIISLPLL